MWSGPGGITQPQGRAIAVIGQTIPAVSTYRLVHREMSVRSPSGDTIGPTTPDAHRDEP
jgi:hypothetical protein